MKHVKNVCVDCGEPELWIEKIEYMLFQPCPPSELPACKILGEGCIYIGSTCYDVILFYSPTGFVFIIIPVILLDSTKTGFIV